MEVGLTYFGKRYLNPLLGRWVSPDPLAVHVPGEADWNLYAYVSGAALKAIDPLGLQVDQGGTGQPNVGPDEPQVSGAPPPSATPQEAGPGTGSEGYHAGGAGKWKSSCEQSQKPDTESGARGTSAGGEGEYQSTPSTPCGPNMCGGGAQGASGDHRYSDPVATSEAMDEASVKIAVGVGELYAAGKALRVIATVSKAERHARLARQLEAAEKRYVEALGGSAARGAAWFERVARQATRNPGSDKVVLGHFARTGTSYQKVAAHYEASYFKLKNWRAVTKDLSQDEIWRINESFLTQQIRQGKQILFSHNPATARPGSFFEREVAFLREAGYRFTQKNQWTWEAVR